MGVNNIFESEFLKNSDSMEFALGQTRLCPVPAISTYIGTIPVKICWGPVMIYLGSCCSAPGSLDTSLSHAAGLIEIAACHA